MSWSCAQAGHSCFLFCSLTFHKSYLIRPIGGMSGVMRTPWHSCFEMKGHKAQVTFKAKVLSHQTPVYTLLHFTYSRSWSRTLVCWFFGPMMTVLRYLPERNHQPPLRDAPCASSGQLGMFVKWIFQSSVHCTTKFPWCSLDRPMKHLYLYLDLSKLFLRRRTRPHAVREGKVLPLVPWDNTLVFEDGSSTSFGSECLLHLKFQQIFPFSWVSVPMFWLGW